MFADSAGSRRRSECIGCEVPQACAWIRDCAKWQREQAAKADNPPEPMWDEKGKQHQTPG